MISVSSDTEMRALVWQARHSLNSEMSMTRMFPVVLEAGTESDAKRENDPDTPSEDARARTDKQW